ncbi:hypothetical protein FE257_001915 [Aspergillus nanangensis]|uniref:Cytochrome P450 n=1 Tax=Aspergillus nanangensis TaxID=2582783 RepID=A0AAD4CD64_ASPNN|nr:hypothetical protein FE257_001915 [Aspergillus nanangensis]
MHSPWLVGSCLVLFIYLLMTRFGKSTKSPALPVVKCSSAAEYKTAIAAKYSQDPNSLYILRTQDRDTYVVPNAFMKEYAWLGERKASTAKDLYDRLLGQYTFVGSLDPTQPGDRIHVAIRYVKGKLSKNINQLLGNVYLQIDHILNKNFGDGDRGEPQQVKVRDFTSELCLHIYEMAYVGLDLARDPAWLDNCLKYPPVLIHGGMEILSYSWWLRPLVAPFLPGLRGIRAHRQLTADMLRPLHMARLKAMEDPDFQGPPDLIQSFIENGGKEKANTIRLAEVIAGINAAGILTTARVIYECLLDLATYREYIEGLRAEIEEVMAEEGSRDLNQQALARLFKMDSFIKESQKFHYNNLLSAARKTGEPLRLSNGTSIPANSYIAVTGIAQGAIDEKGQVRPFDGYQWAEKRSKAENPTRYNYVTSTPTDLEFGGGTHACPGRFFASNVVKSSLCRILTGYDFWFPEGTSRPEDVYNEALEIETDPHVCLHFQRREK